MTNAEYRKFQQTQLIILQEVDRICRKLGLEYYMIGGTLLGSVRHGGFIPWDADIDLAMKREDYDRFKKYWLANPSETFVYQDFETEKNHLSPHALLRLKGTEIIWCDRISPKFNPTEKGIYLDIFPLDTPPKGKFMQSLQKTRIQFVRFLIKMKIGYIYTDTPAWKKSLKSLARCCMAPFSLQFLNTRLDKIMRKYSNSGSGFLVSMASHFSYWKQLMPKEIYGTPVEKQFENLHILAPAQTDAYLTQIYGDYMQLPPVEKRVFFKHIDHIDYGTLEV